MGVSIHYRGQLDDIRKINLLCDELILIANKMGWTCTRLDDDWSKKADATIEVTETDSKIIGHFSLKGIAFTLNSECDSLRFFFDAGGNLYDPVSRTSIIEGALKAEDAWVSVKTQFAGPDAHIWVVGLLKYLKKHYISDLEVHDEGELWETGNVETLKEKMNLIGEKIDEVRGELSRVTGRHLEAFSAEELVSMIETLLTNKFDLEDVEK